MSRKIILQRERRRINKRRLINEFGGKCARCGFIGHPSTYDFHHIDPSIKESKISNGATSYESIKREASKCVMVCANCHREIHARLNELEQVKLSQQLGLNLGL